MFVFTQDRKGFINFDMKHISYDTFEHEVTIGDKKFTKTYCRVIHDDVDNESSYKSYLLAVYDDIALAKREVDRLNHLYMRGCPVAGFKSNKNAQWIPRK